MEGELVYKGSRVSVTNIMGKIKCAAFDLPQVACLPGAKYYRGKYTRVSFKLHYCHCNLYQSGVIVFMGCQSMQKLHAAVEQVSDVLGEHFFPLDITPTVSNMATKFSLSRGSVDLIAFSQKHKDDDEVFDCIYEPELSNGLHFSLDLVSRVILHQTGKGIITGVKSLHEAYCVLKLIHNMLDCE